MQIEMQGMVSGMGGVALVEVSDGGKWGESQQSPTASTHSMNINQRTSRRLILPLSTRYHTTDIVHVVVLQRLLPTEQGFCP